MGGPAPGTDYQPERVQRPLRNSHCPGHHQFSPARRFPPYPRTSPPLPCLKILGQDQQDPHPGSGAHRQKTRRDQTRGVSPDGGGLNEIVG